MEFKPLASIQYIAALGDPNANSGSGAGQWGLWALDPGPRGVRLWNYELLERNGWVAPAGWSFDPQEWWLEENGLIMEPPDFPIEPGQYMVTGDREVTTVLTVESDGSWSLANDAALYDVTHLGCRSARYTVPEGGNCSPKNAPQDAFRVEPGADMPAVEGCSKQDYAVLFVVAVRVD